MRALLMPEPGFAQRERALLRRLAAGLADEGVRVLHAVPSERLPQGVSAGSSLGVFATDIGYEDRGLPLTGGLRARALLADASRVPVGTGLDLVHAWGRPLWDMAWRISEGARCPLVLEVWSGEQAIGAVSWVTPKARGGDAHAARVWFSAADDRLADRLRATLPATHVPRVVACPWGVHAADELRAQATASPGATRLLALHTGSNPCDLRPLLSAVREAAAQHDIALVLDHASAQRCDAWAIARQLGVQARLSVVPGDLQAWDPVLACEALLLPASAGEQSGLTLAMQGAGVPVLCAPDALASNLSAESGGAHVVTPPTTEGWARALARVLGDAREAHAIGEQGRRHIAHMRHVSTWVQGVVKLYDRARGA